MRRARRMDHDLGVIGRLKPGATVARPSKTSPPSSGASPRAFAPLRGWSITVTPLQEALVGNVRAGLMVLLAAVGFVLLIACANLANLLLARSAVAAARDRAAHGARRGTRRAWSGSSSPKAGAGRAGGALGLLLALWGVDLLQRTVPCTSPIGEAPVEHPTARTS